MQAQQKACPSAFELPHPERRPRNQDRQQPPAAQRRRSPTGQPSQSRSKPLLQPWGMEKLRLRLGERRPAQSGIRSSAPRTSRACQPLAQRSASGGKSG